MKKITLIIFALMSLFVVSSCDKDDNPIVELSCNVTSTNVTTNGGNDGSITVTIVSGNGEYDYYINDSLDVNQDGKFENLTEGTYEIKVTDSKDKIFNKSVTITEPSVVPVISTVETPTINVVSLNDVTLNGKVNPNGFATTSLYFEYSTLNTFTTSTKLNLTNVSGNTLTSVSIKITSGLSYNTTYYVRLVAVNAGGTKISENTSFLVNQPPTINSLSATNITSTSVTLNGKVNANSSTTTSLYFEYGTTTSYGTTVPLTNINGNILTDVTTNITNLTPNTTYHYRLVATNDGGTTTSNDMTFKTLDPSYKIGDQLYGGTIFKVEGVYPNQTGLIARNIDVFNYYDNWNNTRTYTITENDKTWRTPDETELKLLFTLNSTLSEPFTKLSNFSYWTSSYVYINGDFKGISMYNGITNPLDPDTKLISLRLITTF